VFVTSSLTLYDVNSGNLNVPSNVSNGNTIISVFPPGYLPYCVVAMYPHLILVSAVSFLCDVVIT